MTAFTSWSVNGVRFLAIPTGNQTVHIVDQNGNNYGSWSSIHDFRHRQRMGNELAQSIGKASLKVVAQ